MCWFKRNWYYVLFAVINLAIVAQPAQAGLKNALCDDGGGGQFACCKACTFFCRCTVIE